MTNEEIIKLFEYRKKAEEVYKNTDYPHFIDGDYCEEIIRFINGLIYKYDWFINADDTHRWVESDGFYEVEFHLHTDKGIVFINNESGGSDLEEEWSENNPQCVSSIDFCYMHYDAWDWYYFMAEFISVYGLLEEYQAYAAASDYYAYGNGKYDEEKVYNAINELVASGKYTINDVIELISNWDFDDILDKYFAEN